jgi:hypothetical protein
MQKEGEEENKMFIRIKYLLQDTMTTIANSRRNTRPSPSSTAEMENRVTLMEQDGMNHHCNTLFLQAQ